MGLSYSLTRARHGAVSAKAGMPTRVPSLSKKEIKETNTSVKKLQEKNVAKRRANTPANLLQRLHTERASIGKYTAENGIASAVRHFSRLGSKKVPESTARRLKAEYLRKMKKLVNDDGSVNAISSAHAQAANSGVARSSSTIRQIKIRQYFCCRWSRPIRQI